MSDEQRESVIDGWAIVELFGHRRLGGRVSEVSVAGAAMLRIDIPRAEKTVDDSGEETFHATQLYGGAAIFSITPVSEDAARAVAAQSQPEPVHRWEIPQSTSASAEPAGSHDGGWSDTEY